MDTLVEERNKASHGKWKDWYRGAYHNGWQHNLWSLQPEWRAEDARRLARLARQTVEEPESGLLMLEIPQPGEGAAPIEFTLPQDLATKQLESARLYGWSDGNRTAPEIPVRLNVTALTLVAMDRSKNPFYRVEFDPALLQPENNRITVEVEGQYPGKEATALAVRLGLCLLPK